MTSKEMCGRQRNFRGRRIKITKTDRKSVEYDDVIKNQGYKTRISVYVMNFLIL